MSQAGLFDAEYKAELFDKFKDPLREISQIIYYEIFRDILTKELDLEVAPNMPGRRPYDPVLIFKILLIQVLYGFSDDQMEFMIYDRASFRRFLDLKLHHKIPDSKTIWLYKERLRKTGAFD